jgi:hypothetical protein
MADEMMQPADDLRILIALAAERIVVQVVDVTDSNATSSPHPRSVGDAPAT